MQQVQLLPVTMWGRITEVPFTVTVVSRSTRLQTTGTLTTVSYIHLTVLGRLQFYARSRRSPRALFMSQQDKMIRKRISTQHIRVRALKPEGEIDKFRLPVPARAHRLGLCALCGEGEIRSDCDGHRGMSPENPRLQARVVVR